MAIYFWFMFLGKSLVNSHNEKSERGSNKMKKIFVITIIGIVFLIIFICNFFGHTVSLDVPDKIIIYQNERQLEIDKNHPRFHDIYSLMNKRLEQDPVIVKLIVIDDLSEIKKNVKLGIEFIYFNKKQFKLNNMTQEIRKVFFPLEYSGTNDEKLNFMYLGLQDYTNVIGGLSKSTRLIDISNEVFPK